MNLCFSFIYVCQFLPQTEFNGAREVGNISSRPFPNLVRRKCRPLEHNFILMFPFWPRATDHNIDCYTNRSNMLARYTLPQPEFFGTYNLKVTTQMLAYRTIFLSQLSLKLFGFLTDLGPGLVGFKIKMDNRCMTEAAT